MHGDELGAVGKRGLDLDVGNHLRHAFHHVVALEERRAPAHGLLRAAAFARAFHQRGADVGHRFRVIELESLALPPLGEQAGGEYQELVLLARRELHALSLLPYNPARKLLSVIANACTKKHRRAPIRGADFHRETRMRKAVLAVILLGASLAAQAQTKWRLAGNFATEHSSSVAMNQFRDELAKASAGQLSVDVFPAMQLGGAAENVQNVRAGTLQMIWVGMAFLSRTVPELEAISLPFQFDSREQAFRVVDGPVGKLLDAKFADKGLTDLGFMELGARHVTNSKRPRKASRSPRSRSAA